MAGSSSAKKASSFRRRRTSLKMSTTDLFCAELLVEILSWLPVDTLFRFRFVCKSWFQLITHDSTLVKMHLLHHHNHRFDKRSYIFLFSKENYETIYSLNLKTDDNDKGLIHPSQGSDLVHSFKNPKSTAKSICDLDFLGSCNGLVCIKLYCFREYHNVDKSTLYIWNPSTKEFKQMPDSPIEYPMNFDNDPLIRTTYGFGYDKNIDDYKVIRCVQSSNISDAFLSNSENCYEPNDGSYLDLVSELKVYTLGTNSWRRIHQKIPYRITSRKGISKPGLLVSGSLHWAAYSLLQFDRIISFDIVAEEYRDVPKPDIFDHDDNYVGLEVLRGCLCLHYRLQDTLDFCLWMMMDYGVKESWTKLVTIEDPDIFSVHRNLAPLWLFKNGKILIGMGYKDLVLCDPKSNKRKFFLNKTIPDFEPSKISYIGSLVSLKSGTYTSYTARKQVKQDEKDPEQRKGSEVDREQINNLTHNQKMASALATLGIYYAKQAVNKRKAN